MPRAASYPIDLHPTACTLPSPCTLAPHRAGKTVALLGAPQEAGHLQQVLGRVSAALGVIASAGVLAIFLVMLCAQGRGVETALVVSMVVFVSTVPIGERRTARRVDAELAAPAPRSLCPPLPCWAAPRPSG